MRIVLYMLSAILFVVTPAFAIQLDWAGQFWFDQNLIHNPQLESGRTATDADPAFLNNGSQYIPGTGQKTPVWYSAFLKLNPKVVVNDSVFIKSEFHVGSPIFGFFGRGFPTSGSDRYNVLGAQKQGMAITAQRYWANLVTDIGTVELGRAPISWGLGAIWHAGDRLFDRYQNTGDMIRLTSKFGNFVVQPAYVKIATGNNVSGATVSGNPVSGNDDITDYDIAAKYDNQEEDFELGIMWTKRIANTAQKSLLASAAGTGSSRLNLNIFDFFIRKKLGRFRLGAEIPLISGDLGSLDGTTEFTYKSIAYALEGGYSSDLWDIGLKLGHTPGQPSGTVGENKFRALYFNQNYRLGLIMFHYNLRGLSSNNPDTVGTPNSPYDNQIVNASYLALNPELKLDRWTLRSGLITAFADEVAKGGKQFYNHNTRTFHIGNRTQSRFMGFELDLGTAYHWDENTTISLDVGVFKPGAYYEFTNSYLKDKYNLGMLFASQVKVGIQF